MGPDSVRPGSNVIGVDTKQVDAFPVESDNLAVSSARPPLPAGELALRPDHDWLPYFAPMVGFALVLAAPEYVRGVSALAWLALRARRSLSGCFFSSC